MTGFARPELLASTEWLADELGRPDVRIVGAPAAEEQALGAELGGDGHARPNRLARR